MKRILIANRGVVAGRIVRACRKMDIESVVAVSDIDANRPYVEESDSVVRLPGYKPEDTYLNADKLISSALSVGADAIHPGYGFLAESADFAAKVSDAGITFIGPGERWIRRMGEKTEARRWMGSRGFPIHAGTGVLKNYQDALRQADKIGYPVILKPAGGGGGIGMSVVQDEDELNAAFHSAVSLAERTFGEASVYLEKYLNKPRHIEVQLIGDGHTVLPLFERDCSTQRRHQKVIEEGPAPLITRSEIEALQKKAVDVLRGYDSLGTLEMLKTDEGFGFLEMNTRLQVEHAVTEEMTGLDLVGLQIQVAAGEKLQQLVTTAPSIKQHAVEARLYSEDSKRMFPSTGCLSVYRPPVMTGVRIDTGYAEGCFVTPYYDPLLAKIVGTGSTREQAIGRTLIAIQAFEVQGVETNKELLQAVLGSEAFILGRLHTGLIRDLV